MCLSHTSELCVLSAAILYHTSCFIQIYRTPPFSLSLYAYVQTKMRIHCALAVY